MLKLQERDAESRTFIKQHFPNDNASVIRADFDGDGNPDYAALLKNDRTAATKLVILLCSVQSLCRSVYELDETAYAAIVYLRPLRPGSNVSPSQAVDPGAHRLRLPVTGIQVSYFEKGTVVLHWNQEHQKFEAVQSGD